MENIIGDLVDYGVILKGPTGEAYSILGARFKLLPENSYVRRIIAPLLDIGFYFLIRQMIVSSEFFPRPERPTETAREFGVFADFISHRMVVTGFFFMTYKLLEGDTGNFRGARFVYHSMSAENLDTPFFLSQTSEDDGFYG